MQAPFSVMRWNSSVPGETGTTWQEWGVGKRSGRVSSGTRTCLH